MLSDKIIVNLTRHYMPVANKSGKVSRQNTSPKKQLKPCILNKLKIREDVTNFYIYIYIWIKNKLSDKNLYIQFQI